MTNLLTEAPAEAARQARRPAMRVRKDGLEMPQGKRWWREVGWRHVVGLVGVVFAGFPVLYIISAAFNPLGSVATTEIIPTTFSLVNFETLLGGSKGPFGIWYLNTIVLCTVVSVAQVLLSTLAAYAFSRFRFYGRRARASAGGFSLSAKTVNPCAASTREASRSEPDSTWPRAGWPSASIAW